MINYARFIAEIGQLQKSVKLFEVAVRDAEASGVKLAIGFASLGAARTACAARTSSQCETLTQRAYDSLFGGLSREHSAFGTIMILRGQVAWLNGDLAVARTHWRQANEHLATAPDTKMLRVTALAWLARAEAALGDSSAAQQHADMAETMARQSLGRFATSAWLGSALFAQAVARESAGDYPGAEKSLLECIENLREAVGEDSVLLKEARALLLTRKRA